MNHGARLALYVLLCSLVAACGSPITKNDLPANIGHAVIALGYGTPSSGHPGDWQEAKLEIPNLIVYENGLVINRCDGTTNLCWTTISPERVERLITDVASEYHIRQDCEPHLEQPYNVTGPTMAATMILRTRQYCGGRLYFGTNAPVLDELTTEISDTKQIYTPQEVSVVVRYYDPDRQDTRHDPIWPYQFSPTRAISECNFLEVTLPPTEATHAGIFRIESGQLFWVWLRPYFPGEKPRLSCRMDKYDGMYWPRYDSLPFERP